MGNNVDYISKNNIVIIELIFMKKSPLDYGQDCVLSDYRNTLRLSEDEASALHMFFSPLRIPIGLTDQEVRICIKLYPVKSGNMKRVPEIDLTSGSIGQALADSIDFIQSSNHDLPEEFLPNRRMTRTRFKRGILKFLFNLRK
ncbi:hypothetical protein EB001_15595 [bacterium]|nr:hypothetical protein [bacterium]